MAVVPTQAQYNDKVKAQDTFTEKVEVPKVKKSKKKYFKAERYAGMKFLTKDAVDGDPTTMKFEKFQVKNKKVAGYDVSTGYLATENQDVIKQCAKYGYISEITEKEYNDR